MSDDIEGWDQLRDEIGDGVDRWLDVMEDLIVESNDYARIRKAAGSAGSPLFETLTGDTLILAETP